MRYLFLFFITGLWACQADSPNANQMAEANPVVSKVEQEAEPLPEIKHDSTITDEYLIGKTNKMIAYHRKER